MDDWHDASLRFPPSPSIVSQGAASQVNNWWENDMHYYNYYYYYHYYYVILATVPQNALNLCVFSSVSCVAATLTTLMLSVSYLWPDSFHCQNTCFELFSLWIPVSSLDRVFLGSLCFLLPAGLCVFFCFFFYFRISLAQLTYCF